MILVNKEQVQQALVDVNNKFDELTKATNDLSETVQTKEAEKLRLQGEYRAFTKMLEVFDTQSKSKAEK